MGKEQFSANLKTLRKVRRENQPEFANWLGIKTTNLNAYESKKNEPTIETLLSIAERVNISTELIWKTDLLDSMDEVTILRKMLKNT